jgi:acyl dehydratase
MWETRKPHVGQTARRSRLISARDIELFTEMTGDRNPLHYDSEYAAASPFGAIIVQGGVTTGILNAIVAEQLPGPGSVFLYVDWSFRAPVRPGDTITGVVEIVSVRDDKPVSYIKATVLRQDDVVALEGTAVCYTVPDSQSSPV